MPSFFHPWQFTLLRESFPVHKEYKNHQIPVLKLLNAVYPAAVLRESTHLPSSKGQSEGLYTQLFRQRRVAGVAASVKFAKKAGFSRHLLLESDQ
jgi:hypothetical protein